MIQRPIRHPILYTSASIAWCDTESKDQERLGFEQDYIVDKIHQKQFHRIGVLSVENNRFSTLRATKPKQERCK